MGKAPLDQLVKEHDLQIEWKAFELRPVGVFVPPKSPEYMAKAWRNVDVLAYQYGLTMQMNRRSKHSRLAHEGVKFATQFGLADAFVKAVFEAQWQDGLDIQDIDTLAEIASNVGLAISAFKNALEFHTFEKDVLEDVMEAEKLGIHAVPCFIVSGKGVMGVQSRDNLLTLLNEDVSEK